MTRHSVTCDQLQTSRLLYDGIALPVWRDPIRAQIDVDEPDDDDDDDEEEDDDEDDEEDEEADDATSI
jgi:hypothetical protein